MKYRTVVIDFPWPLKVGGSVPEAMQGSALKSALPYSHMNIRDIFEFPINEYADKDCLLFLWATCGKASDGTPILQHAFEILEDWDFSYHCLLTWHKTNPYSFWSPLKWATEHVLFAYRGEFPKVYAKMSNLISAPTKKHSQKPPLFYQLLRNWTPTPRIDLFAREAHEGFDGWGNEYVEEGILEPFLKEPVITRPEIAEGSSSQRDSEVT